MNIGLESQILTNDSFLQTFQFLQIDFSDFFVGGQQNIYTQLIFENIDDVRINYKTYSLKNKKPYTFVKL